MILLIGCATEPKKPFDTSQLFWPKPPDPARIRFIDHIYSDLSIRKLSQKESMFGFEPSFFFKKPADVAVDKRGTAYVTELAYSFIGTFNLDDKTTKKLSLPRLTNPLGIGYNEKLDWLAVVSPVNRQVNIYQLPELTLKLVIDEQNGVELINPVDVVIDAERQRIYVSDSKAGYIRVYDLTGKYLNNIGVPGRGASELFSPTFMEIDKDGNIYVVEVFNFRFHVYSPDGETLTTIGTHGTYVGAFARPKGIALDKDGLIYVSDAAFGNVQIFDLKGNVYLFFGTNGSYPGEFQIPEGMYIDHKNRLYVADQRNARVQIFQVYSDKYYEEHPEEAAKYDQPVKTIVPEETEKTEDKMEENQSEVPSTESAPESASENPWEDSTMENEKGSDEPAMMEEATPSDEGSAVAPIEEDPRFDEEGVEPAPEEQ